MTERIYDAQELNDVVADLYMICGLLRCAWCAADESHHPDQRTVEAIGQTIEFAAERVGQAVDRIELAEVRARTA